MAAEEHILTDSVLRNLQLAELAILHELKRICEKNSITYFLIGGTLIGAVRHKGFIPWDDDIDVAMMRNDFDRFCSVCKADLDQRFFLQTPDTDPHSADYGIARIRINGTHFVQQTRMHSAAHDGIYIDIFPYDNLPNDPASRILYGSWFPLLKRVYSIRKGYTPNPRNWYAKIAVKAAAVLLSVIPSAVLKSALSKYHTKYEHISTKEVFLLSGAWGWKKEKHPVSRFTHTVQLLFEDDYFSAPAEYHDFLSEQYGSYMEIPSAETFNNRHRCISIDFGTHSHLTDHEATQGKSNAVKFI